MSVKNREDIKTGNASFYSYAMILATVTIWGGSFASTKYALAQAEPMVILWLRLVIGMPVLFAGLLWERSIRLPSKNEAGALFLMGFPGHLFSSGYTELCNEDSRGCKRQLDDDSNSGTGCDIREDLSKRNDLGQRNLRNDPCCGGGNPCDRPGDSSSPQIQEALEA